MFRKLQKKDINNDLYVFCIGYGLILENKTKKKNIHYLDYNSLNFGNDYNYDSEPFTGGSVKYKESKYGHQYETDNQAIRRENYEEIGKLISPKYFDNIRRDTKRDIQSEKIHKQNKDMVYYFIRPQDFEDCGNHDIKDKLDTKDSGKCVKSIIYGQLDEMWEFLRTCHPTDNEEMISYYALIKLSELIKVYDKVGKKTILVLKYEGDIMSIEILPKFDIFKDWF